MAVEAKPLSDVGTSYATLQSGDLLFVERAGVAGKATYSDFLAEVVTDTAGVTLQAYDAGLQAIATASITGVTGADASVVTGTAGSAGTLAQWNADGDIVANGSALGMGAIAKKTASASATLSFTEFNSSLYDSYVFVLQNLRPATDGVELRMRTSTNGGSSFDSGASDYSYGALTISHIDVASVSEFADQSAAEILLADSVGNGAAEFVSGKVEMFSPALAAPTSVVFQINGVATTGQHYAVTGSGARLSSADVDAVLFYFSSGNITSGSIIMYGLRNS